MLTRKKKSKLFENDTEPNQRRRIIFITTTIFFWRYRENNHWYIMLFELWMNNVVDDIYTKIT